MSVPMGVCRGPRASPFMFALSAGGTLSVRR
jgi:hypothetical protein